MTMQKVVAALRAEHAQARRDMEITSRVLSILGHPPGTPPKKRHMTAEGKRRIAEAQRKRWRKVKAQQRKAARDKVVQMPPRRKAA